MHLLSEQTLKDLDEAAPLFGAVLAYVGLPFALASFIGNALPRIVRLVAGDGGDQLNAMLDAAEAAGRLAEAQKFGP